MTDDPKTVIDQWLDGEILPGDLGERLRLSRGQVWRVRRAARMAAMRAYRRVLASRQYLLQMALGRDVEDGVEEVLRAWLSGKLATVHAAELVGCTVPDLAFYARQYGLTPDIN